MMRTSKRLASACLLTAASLALTACGGGVSDAPSTAAAPAASVSSSAPAFTPATSGEMTLYTWSDYFPESLAKKFTADTGIKLTVDYYDSNETLEAKLRASNGAGYDVVVPSDYMVQTLVAANLLKEVDAASLPNGKNIEASFLDPYFDPGRKYSVPYLYGTTGYMYDTAKTSKELTSWADYFNAPAELGKVGTMSDQTEVVGAALRAVGGVTCSTDAAQLQAAQDLLKKFKSKVSTINSDGVMDRMVSGEESIAMMWNGASMRARAKKPSLKYVYPKEGMALWQDNFTVPAGAKNVPQALTFLNWMMDPVNSAAAANFQRYGSGISGVNDLLDADMKSAPEIVIPDGYTGAKPVEPCTNEQLTNYTQIWESFKG
ncbi:spermidine/putrescine transport system substrate-binding protein [Propionicimonas paludicola]|uniref:Spermidine/putrescine transport system substrate-binding protein n=1 Tax=Propionicimonas paludicola TaxID=185243 RepID=A0A2A9CUD7_9ACTN|nr:extracellular solute-binding protein [Propionicimonas paludicola]PFG17262.1 spermidine/putrescine transport system substrate-binding protein [Propionicimonas paludicola]